MLSRIQHNYTLTFNRTHVQPVQLAADICPYHNVSFWNVLCLSTVHTWCARRIFLTFQKIVVSQIFNLFLPWDGNDLRLSVQVLLQDMFGSRCGWECSVLGIIISRSNSVCLSCEVSSPFSLTYFFFYHNFRSEKDSTDCHSIIM